MQARRKQPSAPHKAAAFKRDADRLYLRSCICTRFSYSYSYSFRKISDRSDHALARTDTPAKNSRTEKIEKIEKIEKTKRQIRRGP